MTTINQLPREILREILRCLPPFDRLSCALVCRAWAEEISSPPLLDDVYLTICSIGMEEAMPAALESPREYRNLRIIGADLSVVDSALWSKYGGELRRLQLNECLTTTDELYAILRQCPKLESLAITGYSQGSAGRRQLEPVEDDRLDGVRGSLLNLQHFRAEFPMTETLLDQLLGLMPNATSVALVFDPPRAVRPIQMVPSILKANRMFAKLDLLTVNIFDEDLLELVATHSASLQHFKLKCSHLTRVGFAALSSCTKLRVLSLDGASLFGDDHLQKIVQNARELETLEVANSDLLTDAGVAHICDLRKLRHLSLFWCLRLTGNVVRNLQKLSALQYLELEGFSIDIKDFKTIARLKELRTLILGAEVDSKMFDMICRNLVKLEKLHLEQCERLTDRDGKKLSSLKSLRYLGLLGCPGITDLTVKEGLESLSLEGLSLEGIAMTDDGLASIAAHHSRLRSLDLFDCARITDDGFTALLRSGRHLEALSLRSCDSLTRKSLTVLGNVCPRLEWFEIEGCRMSSTALERFKKRRPFVCVDDTLDPMF